MRWMGVRGVCALSALVLRTSTPCLLGCLGMKRVVRPLIDRAESGDCACVWTVVSVVCVRDLDDLRVSETHGHSVRVTAT